MGYVSKFLFGLFILAALVVLYFVGWQFTWVEDLLLINPIYWGALGLGIGMGLSVIGASW